VATGACGISSGPVAAAGVRAEQFGDLKEFAWSDYHFGEPPQAPSNDYSDLALFIPYFLYRWRPARKKTLPSGDATIAHAYLRQRGDTLSELERQVVRLGLSEPFTFYEIRSVVPGQEFVLKEMFTGKELLVKERAGSMNVRPADIFYGQMAPMRTITTMAVNAGFLIPPRMKPEIVRLRLEFQDENDGRALTRKDVLTYEHEVRDLFFYIRDKLYLPPVVQNTDGEALVPQTLVFKIGSAQVAFDALAPLAKGASKEELLQSAKHDADGALHEIRIPWLKKGNRRMKNWDNTILGTVCISGRTLRAEVNSDERASRLRREIEKRMGLAAAYKTTEIIPLDVEEMWANRSAPPASEETNELLKDPEAQTAMRAILQEQLESWVKEKIPALGGRTPLQAVKDRNGREMVEALVVDYERNVLKTFPESVRPDIGVLRRLLKLPGS
jgi:hypothetical protein